MPKRSLAAIFHLSRYRMPNESHTTTAPREQDYVPLLTLFMPRPLPLFTRTYATNRTLFAAHFAVNIWALTTVAEI